jgi:hypothetical protein
MMKKLLAVMSMVAMVVLLVCAASVQAQDAPDVRIRLVKRPPGGLLELEVGQSHTFEIQIKSSEPFLWTMAMTDSYYPGRGIFAPGGDRAGQGTEAVLYITLTGKNSTADLPAVCDWPGPGDCWPEGVAPVSIVAGVRFPGGLAVGEQFPFAVVVP